MKLSPEGLRQFWATTPRIRRSPEEVAKAKAEAAERRKFRQAQAEEARYQAALEAMAVEAAKRAVEEITKKLRNRGWTAQEILELLDGREGSE